MDRNETPRRDEPALKLEVACGAVPCDTEEGRTFLQERLAFYGRVFFVLSIALYVVFNLATTFAGTTTWGSWLTHPGNVLHFAAALDFLLVYLLCRGARRDVRFLSTLDVVSIVSLGSIIGITYYAVDLGSHPEAWGILAISNAMVARAVMIPSAAPFTALASCAAIVPVLAGFAVGVDAPAPAAGASGVPSHALQTVFLAAWAVFAVAIATLTSHVIYGLQQEVREARQFGQYTLEERLGKGGMGEVYRARHTLLRRPTAVKLLRPEVAGEENVARFEREVQLTSQLTHPNTIAIYDFGRTPDGIFYYAMEYLDGFSLEELVAHEGAIPPGRAIHILDQICSSLEEAHASGLIHRDVKPANVILCERGGRPDVVKVVDFGLVKDMTNSLSPRISAANTITGTPLYMSPEAIRSPGSVDKRSDVYSVGALAYRLVTGKPLFDSENFMEICSLQLSQRPASPSERLGRPVARDLEALIMKCLEKDPQERPQSAAELGRALRSCADAGSWSVEDARAWWSADRPAPAREASPAPDDPTTAVAFPAPTRTSRTLLDQRR